MKSSAGVTEFGNVVGLKAHFVPVTFVGSNPAAGAYYNQKGVLDCTPNTFLAPGVDTHDTNNGNRRYR